MLNISAAIKIILFSDMISWYFLVMFSLKVQELLVGNPLTRKFTKDVTTLVSLTVSLLGNASFQSLTSYPTAIFSSRVIVFLYYSG